MGTDVEASDGRIAAAERLILVMVPFSDFSCWWFPSRLYITVKMYPCSGGTDTGSPEL